jgi:hypothetical protein
MAVLPDKVGDGPTNAATAAAAAAAAAAGTAASNMAPALFTVHADAQREEWQW